MQVKDLYNARRSGPYYYLYGINPRAYVAYIAGILINVVGFAGAIGRTVPVGATYIYKHVFDILFLDCHTDVILYCSVNFFAGFIVSSSMYWALNRLFPVPATSTYWREIGDQDADMSLVYDSKDPDTLDEETGSLKSSGKHSNSADVHVSQAS